MKFVKASLIGGAIAGALDIVFAFVFYGALYGAPPMRILQSVAAGLVGHDAARAGGWNTATLGAVCHFSIAIVMAAVFVLASRVLPVLTRRALLFGALYGVALYLAMNYVVVPLSAAGAHPPGTPLLIGGALFTHVFFVGIPIALAAKKFG